MEQTKVYALILNHNSGHETVALYNQLSDCSYDNLEIYVIDNSSSVQNWKYLNGFIPSSNLIISQKNEGYAAGNNLGIDKALKANANYVWILNPDIRVEKDSLSVLIETMENDPELAAIGPRIIQRENPERIFSDGEIIKMDELAATFHFNHGLSPASVPAGINYEMDYIAGSCILIRCHAIEAIGKFPEEYFLYFEETDWCFRARQHNWKLAVNSNSRVYCSTSQKSELFHYYFTRNRLLFCKKYHPNFKEVRNYYVRLMVRELRCRTKGKFLGPFYSARVRGLIAGIFKTSFR